MNLVNIPMVAVSKTVVASTTPSSTSGSAAPVYANISLVLDVSPSMAIAATPGDITNLDALTLAQTGTGCSFACHDIDPNPNGTPNTSSYSNYQIARNGGVTLRIDTVKSAAQALTNYVSNASTAGRYSMGLYTMSSLLTTIVPPTTNFSSVSSAIAAVDFDTMSTLVYTLPAPAPANIAPLMATFRRNMQTQILALFSPLSIQRFPREEAGRVRLRPSKLWFSSPTGSRMSAYR